MRGVNGGSRAVNSTLNAAATAIISAENRVQHSTKRKGSSFWSFYWCFGSHKNNKRIGHALSSSESDRSDQAVASSTENHNLEGRLVVVPFVAPPSSPASFYPSEPPSAVQSPVNVNMFSVSSGMYSPSGPTNIFAIGPYANEPQLVSPPVFSNFTTEPSTAPVTPPPECIHLTTPSSPEVPFARLLNPSNNNSEACQAYPLSQYEFQAYQYYPGSPVGQLISPRSGFSSNGSSSPFIDPGQTAGSQSLHFPSTVRPKKLSLDKRHTQDWGYKFGSGSMTPDSAGLIKSNQNWESRVGSGSLTPSSVGHRTPTQDRWSRIGSGSLTPDTASCKSRESCIQDLQNYIRSHSHTIGKSTQKFEPPEGHVPNGSSSYSSNESRIVESIADHRVSFELSAIDVLNYVEKKQAAWTPSPIQETSTTTENSNLSTTATTDESMSHRLSLSSTLGSGNEFNFDSSVNKSSRRSDKLNIRSDWWANEKIVVEEGEPSKGWPSFSTTLQSN